MKFKASRTTVLKKTFLAALLLGSFNAAHAIIEITISPITDNAGSFLLEASGSGSTTTGDSVDGTLFLDSNAFLNTFRLSFSGLGYGSQVVNMNGNAGSSVKFEVATDLDSNSVFSFSGGSTTVSLGGSSYESLFNVGVYEITGSSGMFGNLANGTLTVVPETNAYGLLLSLPVLMLVASRRRRR